MTTPFGVYYEVEGYGEVNGMGKRIVGKYLAIQKWSPNMGKVFSSNVSEGWSFARVILRESSMEWAANILHNNSLIKCNIPIASLSRILTARSRMTYPIYTLFSIVYQQ